MTFWKQVVDAAAASEERRRERAPFDIRPLARHFPAGCGFLLRIARSMGTEPGEKKLCYLFHYDRDDPFLLLD